MNNEGIVVGLDIGTTKVCAVIGERNENGILEIKGIGTSPSLGLKKGVVVNIESTLRAVSGAIEAAEMMSGREVNACWTGIGGGHIDGINSRGVVAVKEKNRDTREIGPDDVKRVLEAAQAVMIPMDRGILQVIPQSYIVDNQKGIRDPLDMIGVRLECEVHIITCAMTGAQNLTKCVERARYEVKGLVLQTLAAGRAVLTDEEKEMGAALIDLGGGTTDMLVYVDGIPYSTASIPAGGSQVTGDISILNNISFDTAEKIKIDAGCCWESFLEDDDDIIVPGIGGRPPQPIPRSHIMTIVKPRMEEIFKMIKEKLDKLSLSRPLGGGLILTGGGAQLQGAAELAQDIFGLSVRVGTLLPRRGLAEEYRNPSYATAVGLMLEGNDREGAKNPDVSEDAVQRERGDSLFGRIGAWLRNEFF